MGFKTGDKFSRADRKVLVEMIRSFHEAMTEKGHPHVAVHRFLYEEFREFCNEFEQEYRDLYDKHEEQLRASYDPYGGTA